ncbi:MAG: acyltransferase [Acetobacteraceae bacterium]|nr:acyltransferase [Acetobacteraceae bacterium]
MTAIEATGTAGKAKGGLSLNRFLGVRKWVMWLRRSYYNKVWGTDLHPTCEFSHSTKFDLTYPRGVHVGAYTQIAFEARILCHDRSRGIYRHTRIGSNCFIGGRSLIMPGVEIGDGSIVGAGAVVTKSVPPGSIVVGNPAKIIREGIKVTRFGRFVDADARGESWTD